MSKNYSRKIRCIKSLRNSCDIFLQFLDFKRQLRHFTPRFSRIFWIFTALNLRKNSLITKNNLIPVNYPGFLVNCLDVIMNDSSHFVNFKLSLNYFIWNEKWVNSNKKKKSGKTLPVKSVQSSCRNRMTKESLRLLKLSPARVLEM